jgi:alkylated DNA repair dioxygenase AlkB
VSFGWQYDFSKEKLRESAPIPQFLMPIREKAGAFTGIEPRALADVLVTEYSAGTAIGWHKDRPHFASELLLFPNALVLAAKSNFMRFRRR